MFIDRDTNEISAPFGGAGSSAIDISPLQGKTPRWIEQLGHRRLGRI